MNVAKRDVREEVGRRRRRPRCRAGTGCRGRSAARRRPPGAGSRAGAPCSSACRSGVGSWRRIAKTNSPDSTKLSASARIASGAVDEADQAPADGRPGALRHGPRGLELAVAVDELVALDERGQVRLVRHVEEDRQRPDHEPDDVQLPHRQHAERVRDGDGREHGGPADVAGDEDRSSTQPVDPGAGRQAEQDERQELDRPEQGDFERRSPASRVTATRGTASRLTCVPNWLMVSRHPQPNEVGVAEDAGARSGGRSHGAES